MDKQMERLYEAAEKLGGVTGQSAVARALNVSPQTVNNWESRGVSRPGMMEAEKVFGCSAVWILTGEGAMTVPGHDKKILLSSDTNNPAPTSQSNVHAGPDIRGRIPLISWVKAGEWTDAVDIYEPGYAERWLPFIKSNGEKVFALRVEGDSMTAKFGKSYPDGCIVFVDPEQRMPSNGDRIVAKLTGTQKTTFKVFTRDAGRTWLRPLNETYPPIFDEFSVIGKVVGKWEDE